MTEALKSKKLMIIELSGIENCKFLTSYGEH